MDQDPSGRPGSGDHEHRPGQDPTGPLDAPAQPPAPLPAGPPPFRAAGPPLEALAGCRRRDRPAVRRRGPLTGVDRRRRRQLQPAAGPFVLVDLVYFTFFHATTAGQSIGDRIMGIRVLDAATGRSLPYVRAFTRALMSNLSALPLFLGYFWMLWEPRKRTWHDIVADSLVVRATYYPPGEFGRPAR
jgi:hypothetical protein